MGNIWGKRIQLSLFGESHGAAVGMTLAGLPPGFPIDMERVRHEMDRRAPGRGALSSPRRESDEWEILSGWFNGRATGTPLSIIIRNENTQSRDYDPALLRPGHADLSSLYRYGGHADYRGGGHFSGRLTAPLVFAGAVARQILEADGVSIGARIAQIHGVCDAAIPPEEIIAVSKKPFPVHDAAIATAMQEAILQAKAQRDSLGGIIECAALGVPGGWGDPFFDSLESDIAAMMFAIPAVKGVSFGEGFAFAGMKGSEANDPMRMGNGHVCLSENHNGGIIGGISSGAPLEMRVVIKPTPSIGVRQTTVNMETKETVEVAFGGRHDPCIVPRAVPVIEAALALCLLDASLAAHR